MCPGSVFRVARVERVPSKLAVTTGNPILNEALKREGQGGNRVTRGCCAKGLKSRETMEGKHERRATSDERRTTSTGTYVPGWLYCNSRVFLHSCTLTPTASPPISPRSSQTFARKTVFYYVSFRLLKPLSLSLSLLPFLRPFCFFPFPSSHATTSPSDSHSERFARFFFFSRSLSLSPLSGRRCSLLLFHITNNTE